MTKIINPKQQELRKVTAFLITVAIVLVASIAAVLYFNGRTSGDVYDDQLDYTNQANFSYDVTKVEVGRNGATLKNNNDKASVILLNPLRISDKYSGGLEGRILLFEEIAEKAPGAEIYYQLAGDGRNWQYYGSQGWQDVGNCTDCYNTAVEVNTNIESLLIESNTLSVKALLVSSEDKKPVLKSINLQVKGEDCSAINQRALSADYIEAFVEPGECGSCKKNDKKCLQKAAHCPPSWDKSSLEFTAGCSGDCNEITAIVCNGKDSRNMQGPTNYEVYYAASGNPKNGSVIDSGQIPALQSGQCHTLSYIPTQDGNYMFKAYQRPGHPGQGVLWSNACEGIDMTACEDPECGDGNLDPGEECDDGNTQDGDGCSSDCTVEPFCGDGNIDPGEECDDGNNQNGDGCSANCEVEEEEPECGNGILEEGEECDDGNNNDGDGCSAQCVIEPKPYFNLAVCYEGNYGEQPNEARFGYLAKNLIDASVDRNTVTNGGQLPQGIPVGSNSPRVWSSNTYQMNANNYVWTVTIDGKTKTSTIDRLNGHSPEFYDNMRCPGICGDGDLDQGEECDDRNNQNGDGCSSECTIEEQPTCGDGNLDDGEECDDGNNQDGDGCSAQCTVEPYCGDGNLDDGEQCDDGNNENGDGCSASCEVEPYCGDGNLDPGEECDDGNNNNGDGCNATCEIEPYFGIFLECVDPDSDGDGYLAKFGYKWDGTDPETTERSDFIGPPTDINPPQIFQPGRYLYDVNVENNGNLVWTVRISGKTKTTTANENYFKRCTPEPECGNGVLEEGEQCDDGNNIDGDGCSAQCTTEVQPYCGDGNVDEGEQCDDGNNNNGDGCSAECTIEEIEPFCGDGNVDEGEECDDGNNEDGDGCSAACITEPFCGDGTLDEGEECDDGNSLDGDGCNAQCTIEIQPFCGDGNLDDGEECDDGNTINGDGCSNLCQVETPNCGDGNVDEGEECDDGNLEDGDGCSSTCDIETPPVCGDGNLDEGEQCDDGNTVSGDGCDANCAVEPPALVVPTTLTLPEPFTPVITPDAIGFDAGACGVQYNDANISFTGFLNGEFGADTVLEYSLTNGLSWRPVQNVDGLGTGTATFGINLTNYPTNVYNLIVRARLADGTIAQSVNCPYSVNLGDLIFGANEFVLPSQQGPMVNTGLIEFRKDEPQRLWIEAKGVTKFIINAYKNPDFENIYKTFELEYDETGFRKLWTGLLEFSEVGEYRLVGVVSGPDGSYSREINTVVVTEGSEIIEDVTLSVYEKQVNGRFELWNGAAVGQPNPQVTENNRFSFILPEGEYYLRANRPGHATLTSRITKLSDQSLVTAEIDMQEWTLLKRITSLFNRGKNNFNLNVTTIPDFALLEVGDLMADIPGVNNKGERYELLDSMGDNTKILMAYGGWNKEAQEQLKYWIDIVQALQGNENLSFAAIGTMPPLSVFNVFNERGSYDFDVETLNFFKPDDQYHDNYFSISLPHFFVIGADNRLKGMVVGSYPPSELSEKLLDIVNQ